MKIGIIIKNINLNNYENTEFKKVAQKEKYNLDLLNIEDFDIKLTNEKIIINYSGKPLKDYDLILNRLGSGTIIKYSNILDSIEASGIRVINNGTTSMLLKDKYLTALKLHQNGINIIPSLINQGDINNNNLIEYPVIHKSNSGSIGKGIYKLDDIKQLQDIIDLSTLLDKNYFYILQDFIDFKYGQDIRVIMVGQKIIGAMKRISTGDDFKANYTIHNNAIKFEVDDQLLMLCQKIVDTLNCEIAGIDLLETEKGYVVCEVNSAPGFNGMDVVNPGLNSAKQILYYLTK